MRTRACSRSGRPGRSSRWSAVGRERPSGTPGSPRGSTPRARPRRPDLAIRQTGSADGWTRRPGKRRNMLEPAGRPFAGAGRLVEIGVDRTGHGSPNSRSSAGARSRPARCARLSDHRPAARPSRTGGGSSRERVGWRDGAPMGSPRARGGPGSCTIRRSGSTARGQTSSRAGRQQPLAVRLAAAAEHLDDAVRDRVDVPVGHGDPAVAALDQFAQLVAAGAHRRHPRPEAVEQPGPEGEVGLEVVEVRRH